METRKNHLQQQIIEALKAKDKDLYSLLKSQWAHRFGVESLDELKNLELTLVNQTLKNEDNQENDQSQNYSLEDDKENSLNDDKTQADAIKDTKKVIKSMEIEKKEPYQVQSSGKVVKENQENKDISQVREYKIPQKVEALIPLPPKPKYSYLNKWLLRS